MADDELADWWVHTVTVTPVLGEGAYGPILGEPAPLTGFLDDTRKLVRNTAGEEVVSEATFLTALGNADSLAPGSSVDLGYRTAEVIGIARRDAPGLDLPEHVEATLT